MNIAFGSFESREWHIFYQKINICKLKIKLLLFYLSKVRSLANWMWKHYTKLCKKFRILNQVKVQHGKAIKNLWFFFGSFYKWVPVHVIIIHLCFFRSKFTVSFLDECDRVKISMHLHSFTYDYHLRCLHHFVAERETLLKPRYHITSFLDDFLKYYSKSPNYARSLVHTGKTEGDSVV